MLTRRQFIIGVISGFVLYLTGCYRKKKTIEISISSLYVSVPVWLINKGSRSLNQIKALSVRLDKENDDIIVKFLGDRQSRWSAMTSALTVQKENANRATRTSMLLKRVISYTLDGIYKDLKQKNKIKPESAVNAEQFSTFQAEEILDVVSISAIYNLLRDLEYLSVVKTIRWDPKSKLFKVS
jgi:hypothetical protein